MDALEAIDPGGPSNDAADTPLLLTGLQPAPSHTVAVGAAGHGAGSPPASAAGRDLAQDVPRSIVSLSGEAPGASVSIAIGLMLDRTGYLSDLREERSEEAEGRIENLMELVSARASTNRAMTIRHSVDSLIVCRCSPKLMKPKVLRKPTCG